MHFGDYTDGAYWSAERDEAPDDEKESYEVSGTTIRFMPDDTVTVPLWDEDGLLPEEPEWLRRALGLSRELVEDIAAWGNEWNAPQRREGFTEAEHEERLIRLDAEARLLVERLQTELPDKFTVVYRP